MFISFTRILSLKFLGMLNFSSVRVLMNLNPRGMIFNQRKQIISRQNKLDMLFSQISICSKCVRFSNLRYLRVGKLSSLNIMFVPTKVFLQSTSFLNWGNSPKIGIGSSFIWHLIKQSSTRFEDNRLGKLNSFISHLPQFTMKWLSLLQLMSTSFSGTQKTKTQKTYM